VGYIRIPPSRFPEQKMPEGSWKCNKCGNINYPFRTKCNRQNCGADKPSEEDKPSSSPPADGNEQVCGVVFSCVLFHSFFVSLFSLVNCVYSNLTMIGFDTYNFWILMRDIIFVSLPLYIVMSYVY